MKKIYKILFISVIFLGCSKPKNCPCGSLEESGQCVWNYFYIDPRPQCKAGPAPCPWPEINGKCKPPKK